MFHRRSPTTVYVDVNWPSGPPLAAPEPQTNTTTSNTTTNTTANKQTMRTNQKHGTQMSNQQQWLVDLAWEYDHLRSHSFLHANERTHITTQKHTTKQIKQQRMRNALIRGTSMYPIRSPGVTGPAVNVATYTRNTHTRVSKCLFVVWTDRCLQIRM